MKKTIILMALLASVFILSACEGIDLSQISDEDLARLADQAIVCNTPYMRFGLGCCLDQDNDSICDEGQGSLGVDLEELYEKYPQLRGLVEDAWDPEYEELDDLGDVEFLEETKNKTQNQKAETMLAVAQKEIEKAAEKIEEAYSKNKSTGIALEAKLEAEEIFAKALDAYNLGNFEESIDLAKDARKLANEAGGKFIDKTEEDLEDDEDEDEIEFENDDQEDAYEEIEDAKEEIEKAEEKISEKESEGVNVTLAKERLAMALPYLELAETLFANSSFELAEENAEIARDYAAEARMKYLGMTSEDDEEEDEEEDDEEEDDEEEEFECSIDSDCKEDELCFEGECEDIEETDDEAEEEEDSSEEDDTEEEDDEEDSI